MGRVGSSPHARGLPGDGPGGRGRLRIIPACAGFTRRERGRPSDRGIIPACAGFTRTPVRRHGCARDHPRMRGVYPTTCPSSASRGGSSPHARGLRGLPFPNELALMDHPRMRGVYTTGTLAPALQSGSSPHARGLRLDHHDLVHDCRIIPACAGFTSRAPRSPAPGWDHPRMRGVYSIQPSSVVGGVGSSPHVRGLRWLPCAVLAPTGIIPACAGFTAGGQRGGHAAGDHPRMRGVYSRRCCSCRVCCGSSPHARGLLLAAGGPPEATGIIPACAGFTPRRPGRRGRHPDHPRMRGVYHSDGPFCWRRRGSSPHARGLPPGDPVSEAYWRIIPACAGFTHRRPPTGRSRGDHPRMRGVYPDNLSRLCLLLGSSPHARGLLPRDGPPGWWAGIIPACAGFT